jgi:hypothetical protein
LTIRYYFFEDEDGGVNFELGLEFGLEDGFALLSIGALDFTTGLADSL